MKIVEKTTKSFSPITLEITIESKEELYSLYRRMAFAEDAHFQLFLTEVCGNGSPAAGLDIQQDVIGMAALYNTLKKLAHNHRDCEKGKEAT